MSNERTVAQDAELMEAQIHKYGDLIGGGCQGYVIKDPLQELIAKEGVPPLNSEQLRCEVFWGLLGYVFADGPHPVDVLARFYAAVRGSGFEGLDRIPAEYFLIFVDGAVGSSRGAVVRNGCEAILGPVKWEKYEEGISREMRKNAKRIEHCRQNRLGCFPLGDLMEARSEDGKDAEEFFSGLFDFYMKHGSDPLSVLRMLYVVAKALREELVGGMSLEALAVLGGDGGRATVSARIKRDYNEFIEGEDGVSVKAYFQKTSTTVENYRRAQRGNHNRADGARRKKRGKR